MSDHPASDRERLSFEGALGVISAGVVPAAAVLAFAAQPILRFADPFLLLMFGIVVAASAAMLAAARLVTPDRPRRMVFWSFMAAPFVTLVAVAADAGDKSDWNDRRCLRIETAMLGAVTDARDDLPDLFQALGCRPQREAPPGAKRSRTAMDAALAAELRLTAPDAAGRR